MSFREHPQLKLVDTTGAGDTYTAAFAVKYAQFLKQHEDGTDNTAHSIEGILECMRFATQAAFLCITRFGTSQAIPYLSEIQSLQ